MTCAFNWIPALYDQAQSEVHCFVCRGVTGQRAGSVRTVLFFDVGIGVFEVTDGKITLWRDYFDLATLMKEWPQGQGCDTVPHGHCGGVAPS